MPFLKIISVMCLLIVVQARASTIDETLIESSSAKESYYILAPGVTPPNTLQSITVLINEKIRTQALPNQAIDDCIATLYEENFSPSLCLATFSFLGKNIVHQEHLEAFQSLLELTWNRKPQLKKETFLSKLSLVFKSAHRSIPLTKIESSSLRSWRDRIQNQYRTSHLKIVINGKVFTDLPDRLPAHAQVALISDNYQPWIYLGAKERLPSKIPKLVPFVKDACPRQFYLEGFADESIFFFGARGCRIEQKYIDFNPVSTGHLKSQSISSDMMGKRTLYLVGGIAASYLLYEALKNKRIVFSSKF